MDPRPPRSTRTDTLLPCRPLFRLPGLYVQKDVAFAHAPNAAIRRYDGRAISDAHSRGCRARVLNRKGDRYTVMQSCVGAGAGAAKQVSQRQTVTVSDALTRSEEHTSELQSLMRISYAVFCL